MSTLRNDVAEALQQRGNNVLVWSYCVAMKAVSNVAKIDPVKTFEELYHQLTSSQANRIVELLALLAKTYFPKPFIMEFILTDQLLLRYLEHYSKLRFPAIEIELKPAEELLQCLATQLKEESCTVEILKLTLKHRTRVIKLFDLCKISMSQYKLDVRHR